MLKLGREKGYTLICMTGNQIFVRNDLTKGLNLSREELENPNQLFLWRFVIRKFFYNILHLKFKLNKQKEK